MSTNDRDLLDFIGETYYDGKLKAFLGDTYATKAELVALDQSASKKAETISALSGECSLVAVDDVLLPQISITEQLADTNTVVFDIPMPDINTLIARASSMLEERVRFDPVPVYDVTLAENIIVSPSDRFIIPDIAGKTHYYVYVVTPNAGSNATIPLLVFFDDNTILQGGIQTGVTSGDYCYSGTEILIKDNFGSVNWCYGGNVNSWSGLQRFPYKTKAGVRTGKVTSIEIGQYNGAGTNTLVAGTTITVYAASPDQRVTEVFGQNWKK